jgi:hypothetical protein
VPERLGCRSRASPCRLRGRRRRPRQFQIFSRASLSSSTHVTCPCHPHHTSVFESARRHERGLELDWADSCRARRCHQDFRVDSLVHQAKDQEVESMVGRRSHRLFKSKSNAGRRRERPPTRLFLSEKRAGQPVAGRLHRNRRLSDRGGLRALFRVGGRVAAARDASRGTSATRRSYAHEYPWRPRCIRTSACSATAAAHR